MNVKTDFVNLVRDFDNLKIFTFVQLTININSVMTYIFLLIAVIAIGFIIYRQTRQKNHDSPKNSDELMEDLGQMINDFETQPHRKNAEIGIYEKHKENFQLMGVGFDTKRIKTFNEISEGETVFVKFEPDNIADKNALGVYTNKGDLIGYLPRNQRKLIKTLKKNDSCFARISYKGTEPSYKDRSKLFYSVSIDLYLGYTDQELNEVRELEK